MGRIDVLAERADATIAQRAALAPAMYAIAVAIFDFELGLWRHTRALTVVLFVFCAARQALLPRVWWVERVGARKWRTMFTVMVVAASIAFGVYTAAVFRATGAAIPSELVLLANAAFVMGGVYAVAPRLALARVLPLLLLGPPAVATLDIESIRFRLATMLCGFALYAFLLARKLHDEFWTATHAQWRAEEEMTARLEAEVKLRQASKLEAVGRLASGVAHEINTPLQYVSTNVDFLGEAVRDLVAHVTGKAPLDGEELEFISTNAPLATNACAEGVARVTKIVGSMREFTRADAPEMVDVDVNRAIERTLAVSVDEYTRVADVVTELAPVPRVRGHAGEISQAVLNIVLNAVHAIEARGHRGTITVRTRALDERVVVTIADDGVGISAVIRDKIFDPFFTTKGVGKGSGQGLAITRAIVVRHRGTIEVDSAVGVGTTFTLTLPSGDLGAAPA